MKIIVGLGNPGKKYEHTRHNAGFMAIDFLLLNDGFLEAKKSREFKSECFTWLAPSEVEGQKDGKKIVFLKPQTFMNDSGQALKIICNFYKIEAAKDLLIIHDDVDLPFGEIRLSDSSSSAGHKGIQSIIDNIGTQNFYRIRIGVESRADKKNPPTDTFVLQNFSDEERQKLQTEILPKIQQEIEKFTN